MNEEKRSARLRLISYLVIAYMLMAFTWWSILLYTKNRDAFYAKRDLLRIGMVAEGLVRSDGEFFRTTEYLTLARQYQRQEWMIFGEGIVFVISLVIGVWFINQGYNKEMVAGQQRRNFLLSITHELKSPLASIRLVIETLLRRELPREQGQRLMGNALQETDRLNTLVNDLLLSAKLETAYQINREEVNLPELLNNLIQNLEDKYPQATFQFAQQGEIPHLIGDKMGLTSVALNLLENAVKYSPGDAQISTRIYCQDNFLFWEVADQGAGINDKEKKRIFDKFYRIGNENTRQTKGTGLGLYIVDQIVRAHGGKIQVMDNQPLGTRFQIRLPI